MVRKGSCHGGDRAGIFLAYRGLAALKYEHDLIGRVGRRAKGEITATFSVASRERCVAVDVVGERVVGKKPPEESFSRDETRRGIAIF